MTEQTTPKTRVFSYNDQTWDDPGSEYSNDDVRKHLAGFFPDLANASIETSDLDDGRQEIKFVKRAGTKAGEPFEFWIETDTSSRSYVCHGGLGRDVQPTDQEKIVVASYLDSYGCNQVLSGTFAHTLADALNELEDEEADQWDCELGLEHGDCLGPDHDDCQVLCSMEWVPCPWCAGAGVWREGNYTHDCLFCHGRRQVPEHCVESEEAA